MVDGWGREKFSSFCLSLPSTPTMTMNAGKLSSTLLLFQIFEFLINQNYVSLLSLPPPFALSLFTNIIRLLVVLCVSSFLRLAAAAVCESKEVGSGDNVNKAA
jgi:ABC-type sugar transport system permease subunit